MSKMLITDLYMLTMGQGYFDAGKQNDIGHFELFFRKMPKNAEYAIASGLRNVIKYIESFGFSDDDIKYLRSLGCFSEGYLAYLFSMKFECDIWAVPEGTVVFANQPILQVRGPIIQAQLFEAAFLMYVNHSSTVATRAARICDAAHGRNVTEQGPRSKQGESAAIEGAADAFIGGCTGTSCVEAGRQYGIPLYGTMAHSFVTSFPTERQAFEQYMKSFPEAAVFLVDTYDTVKSGMPNAIKVAQSQNRKLISIRLDSGDFENLSIKARAMLDAVGMKDTKIIASGSLDEEKIEKLILAGAPIDTFGVGENMTGTNGFGLGMVYKLCAIERDGRVYPKFKVSEGGEKSSLPGIKRIYRTKDKDYVTITCEGAGGAADKQETIKGEVLGIQIFKNGKLLIKPPSIFQTRDYCTAQKAKYGRARNVELSDALMKLRSSIMKKEVLVIIDMVNGFVKHGALHSPLIDKITPRIIELIKDFEARGKSIIAFRDCHEENDIEFKAFPPHCIRGTSEVDLVHEIAVFEKSIQQVFDKNVFDGLAMEQIRDYFGHNSFDSVTLVGCCTDICVQQFALSLKKFYDKKGLGTTVCVVANAVATFDAPGHDAEKEHEKALAVMQRAGILIN